MRVEISEMPSSPFEIFKVGNDAFVRFYENPEEVVREESKNWLVDQYQLMVPFRKNLAASIKLNLSAWMDKAKAAEGIAPPKSVEERVGDVETAVNLIAEVLL